jgi:hypothetical protein
MQAVHRGFAADSFKCVAFAKKYKVALGKDV